MAISQLYPNQRPTLNLNFARSKTLDPRITFTRNSTATYVGSDGLIKTAAAGEARFDHDPVTGDCRGLLIEESRTNAITNSTTHDTTDSVLSVTTNSTTTLSPDGTNNAIRAEGVGNTAHFGYFGWSGSVVSNDVLSIYVKPDQVEKFWLGAAYAQSNLYATFDLGTSPVTVTTGTDVADADVEYAGNGWYRVWMKSLVSSAYGLVISLDPAKTRTALNQFVSIPTGHGLWVFGAQQEVHFPTSYIPTSGSTVTRNADEAEITGTNFTDWYDNSEGTWLFDIKNANSNDDYARIMQTNQQHRFEYSVLSSAGGKQLKFNWSYGGETRTQSGTAPLGDLKLGASYSVGSISPLYNNGTSIASVTNVATGTWTAPTELRIFRESGGSQFLSGVLSSMRYYPTRLTDSQLQELTS